MDLYRIADDLAYTDRPSVHELRRLAERGFRTLVTVRLPNEPRGGETGGEPARLRTIVVELDGWDWAEEHLDRFAEAMAALEIRPALVCSTERWRAAVPALAWHAARAGWSVEELEVAARQFGVDLPGAAIAWLYKHGSAYATPSFAE